MTLLLNSFEGGTSGTTITTGNSGGTSGTAFNYVNINGDAALTYNNTHAAHGSLSGHFTTSGSSGSPYLQWSTGTQTQVWFREYLYFASNPANYHTVLSLINSGNLCSSVYVNTSGKLYATNTSAVTIFTLTNSIPLNQWFRIEGYVITSATVGQVQLQLFNTPDSVTPTETQTSAATQNTYTSIAQSNFGVNANVANVAFWMDDIGLSSTGYLGPSVSRTLRTPAVVASLAAAVSL